MPTDTVQQTDKRSFESTIAAATSPETNLLRAFNARVHSSLNNKSERGLGAFVCAATPPPTWDAARGHPEGHLGQDQPSWGQLPPRWANMGQLGANLGPTWAQLGLNLGPSWDRFGHSGRVAPGAAVFFASGPHSGLISASVVLRLRCCPQSRRSQKYCKNRG